MFVLCGEKVCVASRGQSRAVEWNYNHVKHRCRQDAAAESLTFCHSCHSSKDANAAARSDSFPKQKIERKNSCLQVMLSAATVRQECQKLENSCKEWICHLDLTTSKDTEIL